MKNQNIIYARLNDLTNRSVFEVMFYCCVAIFKVNMPEPMLKVSIIVH